MKATYFVSLISVIDSNSIREIRENGYFMVVFGLCLGYEKYPLSLSGVHNFNCKTNFIDGGLTDEQAKQDTAPNRL